MGDLAHAFRCEWRSLADLQQLVLKGRFGSKPNVLKPFENLKVLELQQELQARGIWDCDRGRKELQDTLADVLKGAQRVPSLLVTDPKQPLKDLHLSKYSVLDCEPLHDLKGHLRHLLAELPHVLPQPTKALCCELLENVLYSRREGGLTGADLRVALLELYKLLKAQDVSDDIKLLETGVRISELLYAGEERRTLRQFSSFIIVPGFTMSFA